MRISVVLLSFAFTFNFESVAGFEINVFECECKGKCESERVWTTLKYEAEGESGTEIVTETIRLEDKAKGCDAALLSDTISINFLDLYNEGLHEELHGISRENETVSLSISEEGVLSLFGDSKGNRQFSKESYCVRRINSTYSSIEICCGLHTSCIRKCCPYGYHFTFDFDEPCVETPQRGWTLPIMGKSKIPTQKIRTGFPECQTFPYNISVSLSTALTKFGVLRRPYQLFEDGTLRYPSGSSKSLTEWKTKGENIDYCVDTLSVHKDKLDMTCGADEQDVLILCNKSYIKTFSDKDWIYRIVYMTGFSVSILFLLITAVVHFLLWEKQNIHAWTILCYVLTLMCFYICLLFIYVEETRKRWDESYIPLLTKEMCFALGVVTHFTGICSFAWLSVINFDLWWTFRILKPMAQRSFDFKRLFSYAIFGISVPTVIVAIAGGFQLRFEKTEICRKTGEDMTIYPLYGEDSCFLANSSQPYYFYVPVGVLLFANLVFYMCTSCQMLRIYNATRQISHRNSQKQKQSCELFLKLFLVMGITWIFQVVLAIVEHDEPKWYSPIFIILDLVNMFQAIAIFIIFVCKRETLRSLEYKYNCLRYCLHPFHGLYRTPTVISRSTDGSTKMSRTELTKHSSIDSTSSDHRRDSELIIFN